MEPITTSLFELYKIGPGPSSSHTLGVMNAAAEARATLEALPAETLAQASRLEVELLGSLSATGQGHGSHRAAVAGLLGWRPAEVDAARLSALLSRPGQRHEVRLGGVTLALTEDNVIFGPVEHDHPFNNTMLVRLQGREGPLWSRAYYSVGGGFVQWEGWQPPQRGAPAHPYADMAELRQRLADTGLDLYSLLLANEQAQTGASQAEVAAGLDKIIRAMNAAVSRGLAGQGRLPGEIGLERKAKALHDKARDLTDPLERTLALLNSYALAGAEENAAGGVVVTAPTLGSAGVVPAVLHWLRRERGLGYTMLRRALAAAGAVGMIVKHNASIAGAEVGCQGEVGVATAMAAALAAQAYGRSPQVLANAAEIALEHSLGLTCDPVGGYVQIPCIERNAMGAVKAFNAYLLAAHGDPRRQKVGFDQVVRVMLDTGRDMDCRYKETSRGGLAVNVTAC